MYDRVIQTGQQILPVVHMHVKVHNYKLYTLVISN